MLRSAAASAAVALLGAGCGEIVPADDACEGVTCSFHGVCESDAAGPSCLCDPGYHPEALDCAPDDPADPCRGVTCDGHGRCRVDGTRPVCDCDPGFRPDESGLHCRLAGDADGADDGATDGGADGDADADTPVVCGDGAVQEGEECDDGNAEPGDGCEPNCRLTCHLSAECDDGDPCTLDSCAPAGGGRACAHGADPGAACEDGNPCTTGEACDEGAACAGGTNTCSCLVDADCDPHQDDEPCNGTLYCDPATHACETLPGSALPPGTPCDDGLFCNGPEACSAARACVSAVPPCLPCQTCDEASRSCTATAGHCVIEDACVPDGFPDPANPCRRCAADVDPAAWTSVLPGTPCDDGSFCSGADACDGAGTCAGTGSPCAGSCRICNEAARSCDLTPGWCEIDGVCHADGADDPANPCRECASSSNPAAWTDKAAGTPCDDGLFCTGSDACNGAGRCTAGGNPCVASCRACNEGADRCDMPDATCEIGGACYAAGTADPANPCRECVPSASATSWTNKAAGAACDDGAFCTAADACDGAGACRGAGNPCSGGCRVCSEVSDRCDVPAGSCDIGGTCWPDGTDDPANPCRECVAAANPTTWTAKAAGAACDDGAFCTAADACNGAGACVGSGTPCGGGCRTCDEAGDRCEVAAGSCWIGTTCWPDGADDPGNACRECVVATSRIAWTDKAAGAACDDGDGCTLGDACDGTGGCTRGGPPAPRLLFPENGTRTGSHMAAGTLRPTFRWLPPGPPCGSLTFHLQADDSCATPGFAGCTLPSPELNATGILSPGSVASYRPSADLPVSTTARPYGRRYYWRVRSCASGGRCGAWSTVRYADVGRAPNDFNGDGYSDLLVGAPGNDAGGGAAGRAYVFLGSVSLDTDADVVIGGTWANQNLGAAVAGAGDVNADGFADFVVGAPEAAGSINPGHAYLFLGAATVDATADLTVTRPGAADRLGRAVAGTGDVNADGFADLLVGAWGVGTATGLAYLLFGGSAPDAVVDATWAGEESGDSFGVAVGGAGDFNADGFADCLVGAPGYGPDTTRQGRFYVFFGGAAPDSGPDVVATGTGGVSDAERLGASVAGLGDFNADGFPDVAAGSGRTGAVRVYYGGTAPDGTSDLVLTHGLAASTDLGSGLDAAGDADGDGYPDLLAGVPGVDEPYTNIGVVYLYRGGPSPATSPAATRPGLYYSDELGRSVAGVGDLNADGRADSGAGAVYADVDPAMDDNTGHALVLWGSPAPADSWAYPTTLWGETAGDWFGSGVGNAR
jgi:hypothetical protein